MYFSDDMYYARNSAGMKDANGTTLTIVQENKRFYIFKLCNKYI